jgi:hypothetical protein
MAQDSSVSILNTLLITAKNMIDRLATGSGETITPGKMLSEVEAFQRAWNGMLEADPAYVLDYMNALMQDATGDPAAMFTIAPDSPAEKVVLFGLDVGGIYNTETGQALVFTLTMGANTMVIENGVAKPPPFANQVPANPVDFPVWYVTNKDAIDEVLLPYGTDPDVTGPPGPSPNEQPSNGVITDLKQGDQTPIQPGGPVVNDIGFEEPLTVTGRAPAPRSPIPVIATLAGLVVFGGVVLYFSKKGRR